MKKILIALGIVLGAITLAADTPCADCHAETVSAMETDVHLRVKVFEVGGRTVGCEGCHGDGAAHAESGDPALIRTFAEEDSVREINATCLGCHDRKGQIGWKASTHAMEGLACTECHAVHSEKASQPLSTCANCHGDQTMRFQLPSHHPVREGQMTCASCHDVHSANDSQLITAQRTNDLCYSCHAAHEGPFVFEHEPVTEDCMTCHDPHGSVSNNLLVASEPALCLQCHDFHFHAGYNASTTPVEVGGIERTSPLGANAFNAGFTTRCTQCHSRIHGTDLPSQTVPGRGRGLMR